MPTIVVLMVLHWTYAEEAPVAYYYKPLMMFCLLEGTYPGNDNTQSHVGPTVQTGVATNEKLEQNR